MFNNIEKFKKSVLITDINYNFILSYDKWLRDSKIAYNTRISRLRLLRAIINEAVKRELLLQNPFSKYKIPQMESKKGYIKEELLEKIENLHLSGLEDKVRDAYLVGVYSGLRFSDITTLKNNHIKDGWLTKQMIKTKRKVEIPIDKLFEGKMIKLIDKYDKNIEKLINNIPSNSIVNKTLHQIFKNNGIDGNLTFHSSRHTFATLLSQKGLPITTIQKLLGHTKIQTTQIYSEVDRTTIVKAIENIQ